MLKKLEENMTKMRRKMEDTQNRPQETSRYEKCNIKNKNMQDDTYSRLNTAGEIFSVC